MRYAGENIGFRCKQEKMCDIQTSTRTKCKYCRYQKCLFVGMTRRERPSQVHLIEGQQLCVVCLDLANGVHFGAVTCEGCKVGSILAMLFIINMLQCVHIRIISLYVEILPKRAN